jgi:Sulfotransferase family
MTAAIEPQTATPERGRRVPDFFIVGHAKCGTTALWEMLRRHPQIYMPDAKEPWFFAREERSRPDGERTFEQTGKRSETLDEYLSLFDAVRGEQRVGEASTSYLWSPVAAGRIAQLQPDARIIAILREPASFLRSLHLQLLQNHAETERDLRRAIALEDERRRGRHIPRHAYWPRALMYSDRVRYVEQLRRYHAVFGRERVLVLIYDDFRRDNEGTVRRVLRFLGVDDAGPIEVSTANPSVRMRSQRFDKLIHTVAVGRGPAARAAKAAVKALAPRSLRRGALRATQRGVVFGSPRAPEEGLMLELRRRFSAEVLALSEYLGRDLVALWGYDSLG